MGGVPLEQMEFCLSKEWLISAGIVNNFFCKELEIYLVDDGCAAS